MKIRFRPVVGAILLTTLISFLIGSFAVWGSYRADLDFLDRNLNRVIAEPLMNPEDAIDEALASVEINSVDKQKLCTRLHNTNISRGIMIISVENCLNITKCRPTHTRWDIKFTTGSQYF